MYYVKYMDPDIIRLTLTRRGMITSDPIDTGQGYSIRLCDISYSMMIVDRGNAKKSMEMMIGRKCMKETAVMIRMTRVSRSMHTHIFNYTYNTLAC